MPRTRRRCSSFRGSLMCTAFNHMLDSVDLAASAEWDVPVLLAPQSFQHASLKSLQPQVRRKLVVCPSW